mmetsp:Transcript_10490/g.32058  ORF Transcript_10490/g.32058 Transcript_10490/m.32058 type:complete len:654 (+) Transcript_10490:457-2418(+)|eukprot:CAMPEP_0198723262 /NCGR_PEP_ID=MMETSP1475-20131203/804_1 /TAXON_ID= ORGANISM="Unidentified sp., Strain CCMP1999" /NCGR_SAMPLE_ID=MMETSP1475 /ASSEMBLY_ACC=CAM_ASM_001111 /LENGTH=653 /DNA_ID=CAMNT_0044484335 /DNA_START=258 /DNA_END=2219 /DNA_ORIENTATION=+
MQGGRRKYTKRQLFRLRDSPLIQTPDVASLGLAYSEDACERWSQRVRSDGTYNATLDEERAGAATDMTPSSAGRSLNSQGQDSRFPVQRRNFTPLSRRSPSPPLVPFESGRDLVPVDSNWLKSHPLIDGGLEEPLEPTPKKEMWMTRDPSPGPMPPPGFGMSAAARASPPLEKRRLFNNRSPDLGAHEAVGISGAIKYAKGPSPGQNFFRRKHPELFQFEKRVSPAVPKPVRPVEQPVEKAWNQTRHAVDSSPGIKAEEEAKVPELHDSLLQPIPSSTGVDLVFNQVDDIGFRKFGWTQNATDENQAPDELTKESKLPSNSRFQRWFGGGQDDEASQEIEDVTEASPIENEELSPSVLSFFNTVKQQAMRGTADYGPSGFADSAIQSHHLGEPVEYGEPVTNYYHEQPRQKDMFVEDDARRGYFGEASHMNRQSPPQGPVNIEDLFQAARVAQNPAWQKADHQFGPSSGRAEEFMRGSYLKTTGEDYLQRAAVDYRNATQSNFPGHHQMQAGDRRGGPHSQEYHAAHNRELRSMMAQGYQRQAFPDGHHNYEHQQEMPHTQFGPPMGMQQFPGGEITSAQLERLMLAGQEAGSSHMPMIHQNGTAMPQYPMSGNPPARAGGASGSSHGGGVSSRLEELFGDLNVKGGMEQFFR